MTVLGPLCATILALFLLQVHLGSGEYSTPPDNPNPKGGVLPRSYFWPSQFDLPKDKKVQVQLNHAYYYPYTINANQTNPRGFLIKSIDNKIVLTGQEEEGARCGHAHTYLASPHVNYTVDAKWMRTDKWWMSVLGKDGKIHDFMYHRSRDATTGDVRYLNGGALAATIRFGSWATSNGTVQVTVLDIAPQVSLETKFFIGLWTTVKLRWDRCHKHK